MITESENKAPEWEQNLALRSQVHMAVRLCQNPEHLAEALAILKQAHVEAKRTRKKVVVETKSVE